MGDLHERCADEQRGFVTRVVNELVREGWLVAEAAPEKMDSRFHWNAGRGDFQPSRWLDDRVYGEPIKVQPAERRPRERLISEGASALRTSELIAILIRSGVPGESAVTAGEKVARHFDERLTELPGAGRAEMNAISRAVNSTAWCQIMAGIELGRRIAETSRASLVSTINSTTAAIEFCRGHFYRLAADARQEEFHIVTLDTKHRVIDTHRITVGTLDASLVHPREVFRPAIRDAASSILLVHNHPSGDPAPSREDRQVTKRLESAGEMIGITVLDHIVIGNPECVSLREID